MRLTLTRDSVAMGDDALYPNEREVELPDGATLGDLARWLAEHGGAAVSVRSGSTWALRLGRTRDSRGTAVAVVTQAPDTVTLVADPALPIEPGTGLHLDYLLAQDVAATLALIRADPERRNLRLPSPTRPLG